MRRGVDRVHAVIRAVLLLGFLAGAPATAAYAGHAIYVSGVRSERAQTAVWHGVPAVVERVRPITAGWSRSASPALVSVRWRGPDRSWRTGQTQGTAATVVGSTVTVWIDAKNRLSRPPLTRAEIVGQVVRAAIAIPVALGLLLAAVGWVASLLLDRHRQACWEADWSATEPRWTRSIPPNDS
jgi:hypothetical protein